MDQPYSYKGSDFNSATSSLFQKSVGRRKSARNSVRGSVSCLNSSTMPQLHHPACRDTFFLRSSTNLQANSKDFWDLNLVSSCQLRSSMNSCLGGIISTRLIIGQPSLFFSCIHILVDTAPGNAALITHHTMQGLLHPKANSLTFEARVLANSSRRLEILKEPCLHNLLVILNGR